MLGAVRAWVPFVTFDFSQLAARTASARFFMTKLGRHYRDIQASGINSKLCCFAIGKSDVCDVKNEVGGP